MKIFTLIDVDGPTRGRTIGDVVRLNDYVNATQVAVGVNVPRDSWTSLWRAFLAWQKSLYECEWM